MKETFYWITNLMYLFHICVIETHFYIYFYWYNLLAAKFSVWSNSYYSYFNIPPWSIWPYVMMINPKYPILRTTTFTAILNHDGLSHIQILLGTKTLFAIIIIYILSSGLKLLLFYVHRHLCEKSTLRFILFTSSIYH